MIKYQTTPAIKGLQGNWIHAKGVIVPWATYKVDLEKAMLEALQAMGLEFPVSESVQLEQLLIKFSVTRTWDQAQLAQLIGSHPHLMGTTFKVEYKPAITKPAIDKLVESGTEIGNLISECFTDKPAKPSFSQKS